MKRIAILLSSYNGEKYINEQIESIMNQIGNFNLQLFIRDDGSTDGTVNIINKCIEKYPQKISLFIGHNIGYNGSFLELVAQVSDFDFYAFSDQDDVWLPNKIDDAIKSIEKEKKNIPILYASTSYMVYDDLKPYGKTREKKKPFSFYNTIIQNICPGHEIVVNNEMFLLLKEEKFDYKRIYVYDSWFANIANLYGKIVFDNVPHTFYRQHKSQSLGYGKGYLGRILISLKHSEHGDGKKYRKQITYFTELYKEKMEELGYLSEIQKFLNANSFLKRIRYIFFSKLYRQSLLETFGFKISYIFGRF